MLNILSAEAVLCFDSDLYTVLCIAIVYISHMLLFSLKIETGGTKMQIWVKRDRRREYGIKNISLSFTEEEETRLIVDKYSKIDISLSEFGLPDTFLWVEKVDKVKTVEIDNTNKLIAEIKKGKAWLCG